MILVIDNYDSFVYNLGRYCEILGKKVIIKRNDDISLNEIMQLNPEKIILSPGPCTPDEAGISLALVKKFCASIPLLGVCLGHQVIAQAFGGQVLRTETPMHGKSSDIYHNGHRLFNKIPPSFF